MLPVLMQSLAIASAGVLSVGSITIVILLLLSDQGWRSGLSYVLGYVGAYTVIGVAAVLIGANVGDGGPDGGGTVSAGVSIILGCLLCWIAVRNWRRPPSPDQRPPRLLAAVDRLTSPKAFALGAAVSVINFKNLAIFLSAISVALLSDVPVASKIVIVLLVILVFCAGVIIPVVIYVSVPDRAEKRLHRVKQALEAHGRPIGIWLPLIFGLVFLARGMSRYL